jgi:hypothetical protein
MKLGEADQTLTYEAGKALTDEPGQLVQSSPFDKVRDCPGRIIILEFISKVSGFSPPEKRVRVTFRAHAGQEVERVN